jgi:uncharacterized membrane protein
MALEDRRDFAMRANRFVWCLSRHWLKVVLLVVFTYVALPFAAPVLMRLGVEEPSRLIYAIYQPLCHQLAFRSWFLFGAQPAYPLAQAGVEGLGSFQDYVVRDPAYREAFGRYLGLTADQVTIDHLLPLTAELQMSAHEFVGNPQMGYKVALCQRDVAIYGGIFVGGLLFALVRHRLQPVPFWLYLLLGVVPIALDGLSQLLSYPPFGLWPVREARPSLRVLTGVLFGLMNVWLAFPHIELSMWETKQEIERKLARAAARDAALARLRARLLEWEQEEERRA